MTVRMGTVIQYRGATPQMAKRKWNEIRRTAGQDSAQFYFDELLAKRFTPAGARELNYGKRKPSYMKAKARQKGHQNPLEWTGETKERALSKLNSKTIALGSNFRVEISIDAPVLNFKNPKSSFRPSEEIRRISSGEQVQIEGSLNDSINKQLSQLNDNQAVKS